MRQLAACSMRRAACNSELLLQSCRCRWRRLPTHAANGAYEKQFSRGSSNNNNARFVVAVAVLAVVAVVVFRHFLTCCDYGGPPQPPQPPPSPSSSSTSLARWFLALLVDFIISSVAICRCRCCVAVVAGCCCCCCCCRFVGDRALSKNVNHSIKLNYNCEAMMAGGQFELNKFTECFFFLSFRSTETEERGKREAETGGGKAWAHRGRLGLRVGQIAAD